MTSLTLRAMPRTSMSQPTLSQPYPAQRPLPEKHQFSLAASINQFHQIKPAQVVPEGRGVCMPDNFYDGPKSGQKWEALFSTDECKRSRRSLAKPYPAPIIHSDLHRDCSTKADELINQYPRLAATITIPNSWDEVYKWFDAYDLYVEGAKHCMNVLQEIGRRNANQKRLQDDRTEKIISTYADEWMVAHRDQVLQNPPHVDIFSLFWPEEQLDRSVNAQQITLLRIHLEQRRRLLQSIQPPVQALYPVREGSSAVLPFSPVLETAFPLHTANPHQPSSRFGQKTFNNPEQSQDQRQVSGGVSSNDLMSQDCQTNWKNQIQGRYRVKSNDFNYNSSFPPTNNSSRLIGQNGRRTISNTPRPSPQHRSEPVIYNSRNYQQPSPINTHGGHTPSQSGHFKRGSMSNDARVSAPQGYYNRGHDHNEHRERYNGPGNIREVMKDDPRVIFNGYFDNPTYFYVGKPKRFNETEIYDRESRTARVENVPKDFFLSHKLKEMMSACGEVQTIHYLNEGANASGCALVTFNQNHSVELAIRNFDQTSRGDGFVLHVTAYERRYKLNSRSRANSQYSQGSYSSNRRDSLGQSVNNGKYSHRYSISRPSSGNYSKYHFPNFRATHFDNATGSPEHVHLNGMETPLALGTSETLRDQALFDQSNSEKPLASIGNFSNTSKKRNEPGNQRGASRPGTNLRKENSPTRSSEKDTESDVHSANTANDKRGQGSGHRAKKGGGKYKGSKQNSSTRPTPTPSPTKDQSSTNFFSLASESRQQKQASISRSSNYLIGLNADTSDGHQIALQNLLENRSLSTEQFKKWKHENKASVSATPLVNCRQPLLLSTVKSFVIGGDSEPTTSPTSTVASAGDSSAAKSSHFTSSCSSHHEQSVVAVKSEVNSSGAAIEQNPTETGVPENPAEKSNPTQHSKKRKNVSKSNAKNISNKGSTSSLADSDRSVEMPQGEDNTHNGGRIGGDSVSGAPSKKSHKQKKKNADLVESYSPNVAVEKLPKHIKPAANSRKIGSAVTVDKKFENSTQDQGSLAQNDVSVEPKLKNGAHTKNLSTLSATSSFSRISDAKLSKVMGDSIGDSPSEVTTPRKLQSAENLLIGSSTNYLEVGNLTSWPALGPSASPQSSIADDKRPPPISAPINTARTGASRKSSGPTGATVVIVPAVPNISRNPRPQS